MNRSIWLSRGSKKELHFISVRKAKQICSTIDALTLKRLIISLSSFFTLKKQRALCLARVYNKPVLFSRKKFAAWISILNARNKDLVKQKSIMYVFTVLMSTLELQATRSAFTIPICISWLQTRRWMQMNRILSTLVPLNVITRDDRTPAPPSKQSFRGMHSDIRLIESRGQLDAHYGHLNRVFGQLIFMAPDCTQLLLLCCCSPMSDINLARSFRKKERNSSLLANFCFKQISLAFAICHLRTTNENPDFSHFLCRWKIIISHGWRQMLNFYRH